MIFLIFTLLVALFVAIFAVQNAAPVAINLLWYVAEVPLVLVILGSALAGALMVFFIAIWREFRLKGKVRAKTKEEAKIREETKAKEEADKADTPSPAVPALEGKSPTESDTSN